MESRKTRNNISYSPNRSEGRQDTCSLVAAVQPSEQNSLQSWIYSSFTFSEVTLANCDCPTHQNSVPSSTLGGCSRFLIWMGYLRQEELHLCSVSACAAIGGDESTLRQPGQAARADPSLLSVSAVPLECLVADLLSGGEFADELRACRRVESLLKSCICAHKDLLSHAQMHAFTCMYASTRRHSTQAYTGMIVLPCMYMHTYAYTHACSCMHMDMHTHTYSYTCVPSHQCACALHAVGFTYMGTLVYTMHAHLHNFQQFVHW